MILLLILFLFIGYIMAMKDKFWTICVVWQWLNGVEVMTHSGGHLPFEAVVNSVIIFSKVNRITVAINNTLTPETLPPGTISYYNTPE